MLCVKCNASVEDRGLSIIKHFRDFHPRDKDLLISCPQCTSVHKTLAGFQRHWYKYHHVSTKKRASDPVSSSSSSSSSTKRQCLLPPSGSAASVVCITESEVSPVLSESTVTSDIDVSSASDNPCATGGNILAAEESTVFGVRVRGEKTDKDIDLNVASAVVRAAGESIQSFEESLESEIEVSDIVTDEDVNVSTSMDSVGATDETIHTLEENSESEGEVSDDNTSSSGTSSGSCSSDGEDVETASKQVECKQVLLASQVNEKAASFILNLKGKCMVPSTSMNSVLVETESLIADALSNFASEVNKKLEPHNISLDNVMNTKESIQSMSQVFDNIKTKTEQTNYFNQKLSLVEPQRYPLGRVFKKVRRKNQVGVQSKIVYEEYMYVPVDQVVDKLINHPDYQKFAEEGALRGQSKYLDSYMKGEKCKTNKVLTEHPDALRFVLYYDDLEVCSPLKSRATNQKIGAFYMFIENIPPKYRSQLSMIFVVAIVNANLIKGKAHGIDAVLERIVADLKKFEKGVVLKSGKTVFGTLISVIGDNLGSNAVGGFKEGFTAHRSCRVCMATRTKVQQMVEEDDKILRTKSEHTKQCNRVQTTRGKNESLSKEYGVNRDSALNGLDSYHVIGGLPPDLMHDLLEGVLPLTIRKLLHHYLYVQKEKKFTLDWLNKSIRDFDYGYSELDEKPSEIKEDYLKEDDNSTKLHQSASQMWLLATILPMILGPIVGETDEYFLNFLDLLEVCRISFSQDIEKWMVSYLKDTIAKYLTNYRSLYGNLIPKQHNLIHYPTWILQVGSLVNYLCMRCEAKHKEFKKIVMTLGSYRNVPFTIITRHQLTQAAAWSKSLCKLPTCGPCSTYSPKDFPHKEFLHPSVDKVMVTNWLKSDGAKFVPEKCYICIGHIENYLPVFAKVVSILVYPKVQFICKKVNTLKLNEHYAAYQIVDLPEMSVYSIKSMLLHFVLQAHNIDGDMYIAVRSCAGGALF